MPAFYGGSLMTISARRMTSLAINAALATVARVSFPGGAPPPAPGDPAYLRFASRALDPVAAPLLRDDSAALGTLEGLAAGYERFQ